jgi:hypothetical protein
MLIQVMPCFLGKVEGVSRGIAVKGPSDLSVGSDSTALLSYYICIAIPNQHILSDLLTPQLVVSVICTQMTMNCCYRISYAYKLFW